MQRCNTYKSELLQCRDVLTMTMNCSRSIAWFLSTIVAYWQYGSFAGWKHLQRRRPRRCGRYRDPGMSGASQSLFTSPPWTTLLKTDPFPKTGHRSISVFKEHFGKNNFCREKKRLTCCIVIIYHLKILIQGLFWSDLRSSKFSITLDTQLLFDVMMGVCACTGGGFDALMPLSSLWFCVGEAPQYTFPHCLIFIRNCTWVDSFYSLDIHSMSFPKCFCRVSVCGFLLHCFIFVHFVWLLLYFVSVFIIKLYLQ